MRVALSLEVVVRCGLLTLFAGGLLLKQVGAAAEPHGNALAARAPTVDRSEANIAAAASAPPVAQRPKAQRPAAFNEASASAHGPQNPIDMLRERLAQKLGARMAAAADTSNTLRVTSKATPTPSPSPTPTPTPGLTPSRSATGGVAPGVAPGGIATTRLTDRKPQPTRPGSMHGFETAAASERRLPEAAPAARAAPWGYQGEAGPESWAQLKPEFAQCARGQRQSPIDIRDGFKVDLEPVRFDYRPSAFRVIDNGHTVQVNVGAGNWIEVLGRRFELVEFHFHRPSEERIDGRVFDMVAHLLHKDADGHLAMVAVLLDRGSAQPIVQSVWNNLPLEKGEEAAARSLLDLNELLPEDRSYYTYMGSMTTPPCSEGVLWMVMKKPVPISAEQIGIFARLYPMNARPVQAAAGRMVKESN